MLIYCKQCEAANSDSEPTCTECGNPLKGSTPRTKKAAADGRVFGLVQGVVLILFAGIVAFGVMELRDRRTEQKVEQKAERRRDEVYWSEIRKDLGHDVVLEMFILLLGFTEDSYPQKDEFIEALEGLYVRKTTDRVTEILNEASTLQESAGAGLSQEELNRAWEDLMAGVAKELGFTVLRVKGNPKPRVNYMNELDDPRIVKRIKDACNPSTQNELLEIDHFIWFVKDYGGTPDAEFQRRKKVFNCTVLSSRCQETIIAEYR